MATMNQMTTDHRFTSPPQKFALLFLFLTTVLLISTTSALAQDDAPTPSDTAGVTSDEVNEVARELWCPLCSGVRLDVCELKACEQMREEIAIKLEEGQDTAKIKRYFVTQYGPQVLGEPPKEGFNLLGWILPIVIFVGGGIFVVTRIMRMLKNRREQDEETALNSTGSNSTAVDDKATYADRLDEELSRYD